MTESERDILEAGDLACNTWSESSKEIVSSLEFKNLV
jgi:hypothetical protein